MMTTINQSASALFEQLIQETRQSGSEKTAAQESNRVFPPGFFAKVASQDEEATSELEQFVAQALEAGHSPEEIEAVIAEAEAEEAAESGQGGEWQGDEEEGEQGYDEGEAAIFARALADELNENPVAKVAGIQADHVAQFLHGDEQGETYFEARAMARDVIEKIAASVIPTDDAIVESLVVLENNGFDVSALVAEVEQSLMSKSASEYETPIARAARERAEQQQAVEQSLALLDGAGFDLNKIAGVREFLSGAGEKAKAMASRTGELAMGGQKREYGPIAGHRPGNVRAGYSGADRVEALKSLGTRAALAAPVALAGAYGAKKLYDRMKAKKEQSKSKK